MKRLAILGIALALVVLVTALGCVTSVVQGTVEGTVRDGQGAPIPSATVEARQGDHLFGQAVTNASGEYKITGLEPGTYSLTASKTGHGSQTLTVTVVASGTTSGKNFVLDSVL